jgi:hypothetical protein
MGDLADDSISATGYRLDQAIDIEYDSGSESAWGKVERKEVAQVARGSIAIYCGSTRLKGAQDVPGSARAATVAQAKPALTEPKVQARGKVPLLRKRAKPDDDDVVGAPIKKMYGESASAASSREQRSQTNNGTFKPNQVKLDAWKDYLHSQDPDVQFDSENIRSWYHSRCKRWHLAKAAYNITRCKKHLDHCTGVTQTKKARLLSVASANTQPLSHFFGTKTPDESPSDVPKPLNYRPCPGLTKADDIRILAYLDRTTWGGGGAPSEHKICKELFQREWSSLSKKQKDAVWVAQQHQWLWRNDFNNGCVFATDCEHQIIIHEHSARCSAPCIACNVVLALPAFKVAIRRKPSKDANAIFTNKRFEPSRLALSFARMKGLKHILMSTVS